VTQPSITPSSTTFSEHSTAIAVTEAAARLGIRAEPFTLIRLGSNAVFGIPGAVVARVSRPSHTTGDELRRLLAVARWLESCGVPAVRALQVDQPVYVHDLAVTFWDSLGDGMRYGSASDLGTLLRQLHGQRQPAELGLPTLRPFAAVEGRLSRTRLTDDDRGFLRSRLRDLEDDYAGLCFELPSGPIHGDASVGNVLIAQDGAPTLIDLDEFATGPREWDLVLTALFFDRLGWHTQDEYAAFVEAYGVDIMAWSGYSTLADVREFLMLTWVASQAGESEKMAAELALRIDSLRTGGSRRGWNPY
jgi:aminoglycoside phosphotransferase (APT) family kinase protein